MPLLVLASAARLAAASEATALDASRQLEEEQWNGHYYDVSEESLDVLRSTPGEAQRTWLVQFYTPWCSRCRKFHDAWSELAAATPGQRSAAAELRLARLDAAASPAVIGRFGLRGFPAFLLFDGAQFHRYRGELSLAGLQSFVGSGGGSAHPEAVREASAEFAPTTFRADEQTDRQLMTELGPHRPPHRRPLPDRTLTDRPPPCAQASRSRRSASCSASCSAASAACAGAPACSRAACAAATVGSRRRRKGTERRRPTERAHARRCCAPGAPTLSQFLEPTERSVAVPPPT